jgi:hypothetical protein
MSTAVNPLTAISTWSIDPANSSVYFKVRHTRDEQRDAHLRSPDFLDTERHPLLTFRSTKVEKTGVDTLLVQGDLTIHGVTRNVELDVDSISPAPKIHGATFVWRPRRAPSSAEKISD